MKYSRTFRIGFLLASPLGAFLLHYAGSVFSDDKVDVLIISGHVAEPINKPNSRGALSFGGTYEYVMNDAITALFADPQNQITGVKYRTLLATRNIELRQRSILANSASPDLVIEIHHDSASQADKDRATSEGVNNPIWDKVFGYSVHLSKVGIHAAESERFAVELAKSMRNSGFLPSTYLSDAMGIPVVDRSLGIYERKGRFRLYLLNTVRAPVVLFEVGNIANPREERHLEQPRTRRLVVGAINEAIAKYFGI